MTWCSLSPPEVLKRLKTNIQGLTQEEAQKRLVQYGENKLEEKKPVTPWQIFFNQFKSVLIAILLIASIASFAIGEITDAFTILAIVILNAILGFTQEFKAEKALEALKKMLALKAKVIRAGNLMSIDTRFIVPGDIVVLEIGEKVPADIYLLETESLQIDESVLTGESVPVSKETGVLPQGTSLAEQKNMAFMGTIVTNGYGRGLVVATGMQTEFGQIARLTQEVKEEESPLKKRLNVLGRRIGEISLVIALLVVILGIVQKRPLLEMLLVGISLAVAAIPEGLPAVVTMTLALGVKNMVKRNCLLRNLTASEGLGATSVICTDKTGTLTKNEMTVKLIYIPDKFYEVSGEGYQPKGDFLSNAQPVDPSKELGLFLLLKTGLLCNRAVLKKTEQGWQVLGDPTEGALVVAANKAKIFKKDISCEACPLITEFSFTSVRKRMTVIYHYPEKNTAYVKGAPEVLLPLCQRYQKNGEIKELTKTEQERFNQVYKDMAAKGLRILALAYKEIPLEITHFIAKEVEKNLIFLGFAGIVDPPRPEVKAAMERAKNAGIEVIMMTGDSPLTALAVAREISLFSPKAIRGTEIEKLDEASLRKILQTTKVFARVNPAHKLKVVDILQKQGHITAMTGDGVNDAPALKKANIGIAMGIKGTDVAKEAADIVLLDDNFASIVSGVEEGRREYDNIQRFTRYLLSSNFAEIVAIAGAMFLKLPLILLPVQILWMNLITDGMTALALGMEPPAKDVMHRPPRDPQQPILSKKVFLIILAIGIWMGVTTIFSFTHYLGSENMLSKARTIAFTGIIIFEKINVFNFRSFRFNLWDIGFFSNPFLIIAWLATISLQIMVVYFPPLQHILHTVPLNLADWGLIFILGIPILIAGEIFKFLRKQH
ncbi:Calcium-transporting ATPase 1 [Candidatus Methanoperedenaceae archaeon GB50]|nr:Calcium-transporting ATPase 1 [Candidatus Methanoperedenaceae archaeon GB50]